MDRRVPGPLSAVTPLTVHRLPAYVDHLTGDVYQSVQPTQPTEFPVRVAEPTFGEPVSEVIQGGRPTVNPSFSAPVGYSTAAVPGGSHIAASIPHPLRHPTVTSVVRPSGVPKVRTTDFNFAPPRPPVSTQRKQLPYRAYKEGNDPDAHLRYFDKCAWFNGEIDEQVIITLFGTTLVDKAQRWFDDWLDHHLYCTWEEVKGAFKLRYREQDSDEQVYMTLRTFKQGEGEKVQDYYERFMKLIKCLQTEVGEGFKLTYFRAGLLDYLKVTTSGSSAKTLTELKELARRCETNCTDASGKKLYFQSKRTEPTNSRATAATAQADQAETVNRRSCSVCKKFGHEDKYCFVNPDNPNNRLPRTDGKPTVGVHEVSATQPISGPGRPVSSRTGGYQNSGAGRIDGCFLCLGTDHQMRNCHLRLKFQQMLAAEKQRTNSVGVNSVELQELDDLEVATILTRAARVPAGLPLEDKEVKEPEPRQPKTQAD